ncbi:MAG: hypothetical protein ACT4OZ_10670 [Gemmatimonadota bacterium]
MLLRAGFASMWPAVREQVRRRWDRLTDEDLEAVQGSRDSLLERIRQRYDLSYERIDRAVSEVEIDVRCAERAPVPSLGIGWDWT